jgi:uncharacterized protein
LKTITLEEHFVSAGFIAGPGRNFMEQLRMSAGGERIVQQLQEVGDRRVAEMDAAGIGMQVLSLNPPGVEQSEVAEQLAIAATRKQGPAKADIPLKANGRRALYALAAKDLRHEEAVAA